MTSDEQIDKIIDIAEHDLFHVNNARRILYRQTQAHAMNLRRKRDDKWILEEIIDEITEMTLGGEIPKGSEANAFSALEEAYCAAAYWSFDKFMLGLELRRDPADRFYEPRRKVFKPIVDEITKFIVDDKYDLFVLNLPPRTGKTTTGMMATAWAGGRQPNKQNILTGYSGLLTDSFYKEIKTYITDPEYNYGRIFPSLRLVGVSAEKTLIDLTDDPNRKEMIRYPTFAARAIGGSLNGQVEAANLLYCDDLTRGYEEALSIDQMDKLYAIYTSDLLGRAKEGYKQFHIGTRWSIHDVLGRLIEINKDNPRAKIIQIPALDEKTDTSNFVYRGGFTTKHYRDMRKIFLADADNNGPVTWECLYQQHAIERGSIAFPENELTQIDSIDFMKDNPADEMLAFCDVAFGGNDFLSLPIAARYGEQVYIVDWLYVKGDYKLTQPLVYGKLRQWNVTRVVFEANNGGEFYARDIEDKLNSDNRGNVFVSSRFHSGNQRKADRIEANVAMIKEFAFLSEICYNDKMYRSAFKALTTYSRTGHNRNDDAPDSLAGLAAMVRMPSTNEFVILDRKHM